MQHATLRALAAPILEAQKLKMPETFGLAAIDGRRTAGIVLYSVGGPDRFCFNIAEGFVFPLHTSAPGKAFLAALPEKRRQALLKRMTFKRYTPRTITSRQAFEREVARIRKLDYATDLSEETVGCHCGGVAIRDRKNNPLAALWVTGMARRLSSKKLLACLRILQQTAAQIEAALCLPPGHPLRQPVSSERRCVAIAKAELAAHPSETVFFAELARACGVSYSTLRTAFRADTGTTLGQYQLGLRLGEARLLLADTDLSITVIAERTGFCNQKHFSALFKRKTGVSPLACRRRMREGKAPSSRGHPGP